jgi:hypothetical protein
MKTQMYEVRFPGNAGRNRRGLVLVVVMVVVVMISLAGFGYVASMSNENKSVHLRSEQLQMENAVASAEEFLKQRLQESFQGDDDSMSSDSTHSNASAESEEDEEALMRGIVVVDEDGPGSRVRFTVMAPHYDDSGLAPWHYGVACESTRLDLRSVMDWEKLRPGTGRKSLLGLPGMTEAIADALLDWMDSDGTPRQSGAEQDYYATLNPPYSPRNGIPESLEELLLIKGITRSLLFGRDSNQNHRLDQDELSASNSSFSRDAMGEKQLPWAELLTLYSGERNQSRDGHPRIHLNQFDLAKLHRQLAAEIDVKFATYVILFRQYGPSMTNIPAVEVSTQPPSFAIPAKFFIRSPFELVQSRVQVQVSGGAVSTVKSPITSEGEKLDEILGIFYDRLTVTNSSVLRGRVNVNTAPAEVLRSIPGIDKALAEQIVTSRSAGSKNEQRHEKHPYWLFTEGLVDLNKMKELFPYLTIGGDVYRAQIVAFSEASRLSQRVEIVLDASHSPARRLFWKDLQVLGRGYPWDVLDTPGGISTQQSGASDATSFSN